jgi:glycosyltransferase involved in cell wall biosynthesis
MDEKQSGVQLLNNWIEKTYLRSVDGFIFNSQTTAVSVSRFSEQRPSVIAYPGKDRYSPNMTKKQIAQRSQQKGPLGIVFLGNITPRKGLDTLIRALQPLSCEQWRLTVIGSTEYHKKYNRRIRKQVSASRINDSIKFTGEQSVTEVARHLSDNHVLVVPSRYEGYGLAYVEGMGFGLPAIGTSAGGASEIVDHDVNGFLIRPDDVAALTGVLRLLMTDRQKLQRMSTNALQSYTQFPSWQDTTRRIRDFLSATMTTVQK